MTTFEKWNEVQKLIHLRNNLEKYISFGEEKAWTWSEENISSFLSQRSVELPGVKKLPFC